MKFQTRHLILLFICIFVNLYVVNSHPTTSVDIEKKNVVDNSYPIIAVDVEKRGIFGKIKKAAKNVGKNVKNAAQKAGNGIKNAAQKAGNGVKNAAQKAGNGVKNAAQKAGNGIKNAVQKAGNGVKNAADKAGNKAKDVVEISVSSVIHNLNDFAVKLGIDTAKLGAMFLDMKKDSNGIYHANFDCWQSKFGYNKLYDIVFDLGTSMDYNNDGMFSYNGEKYILWAWKGDYVNLGAGAELGIYYGGSSKNSHWKVKKSLAMPMTLTLTHRTKGTIVNQWNNWGKDAWWITAFNPKYRNVKAKDLTATFTVKFKDAGMFNAFSKTKAKGWKFNTNTRTATLVL